MKVEIIFNNNWIYANRILANGKRGANLYASRQCQSAPAEIKRLKDRVSFDFPNQTIEWIFPQDY